MIDNYFRERIPKVLNPLNTIYRLLGVTPNILSILGLLLSLGAATFVALGSLKLALCIWWISRIFDGSDGNWARVSGQMSPYGAYLDIVADMAAYSAMVLGLAYFAPEQKDLFLLILFLYVLCVASALALGAQEQVLGLRARDNRALRLGSGIAEAGETSIYYTLCLLFPGYLVLLSQVWIGVLILTIVLRSIIAAQTLSQREN